MFTRLPWLVPLLILVIGGILYLQITARPANQSANPRPSSHANPPSSRTPSPNPGATQGSSRAGGTGFLLIRGAFVIIGKSPDGDSVRFVADDPWLLRKLKNAGRVRPSKDGSVQLRFEAIDAPELHFGNAAQPLGAEARDALLKRMGFQNVTYQGSGETVASSQPERVRGAILAQAAEANGRPVSYALLERDIGSQADGSRLKPDPALLKKTLNDAMLRSGLAYYTVYSSTPADQRDYFRAVALEARAKKLGVWAADKTAAFTLQNQASIGENGALILPKLFRRCTSYLQALEKQGFSGSLTDWLIASEDSKAPENDSVRVGGTTQKLSDLLEAKGRSIRMKADLLDLVFLEK